MRARRWLDRRRAASLVLLSFAWAVPAGAQGLHGYIASGTHWPPEQFTAGISFHAAVWSLIDTPLQGFQVGLPSTWISPDNNDNTTEPQCPVGTTARDNWEAERGPTFRDVFQTIEGGLGYWAGNRFHYGPPKFSMNSTPDCYTHQIASPGWPFFQQSAPIPDDFLGIAQLSNRILIPPDGLTFAGTPHGEFLGFAYMALPLTDARPDPQPTGDQNWTLFLHAANFRGPVAYFLPETWSRMASDYDFPFVIGRGLDARRAARGGGGTMEISSVPILSLEVDGTLYSKIPRLQFPVNELSRTILSRDVTFYSKAALFDDVAGWRAGGPMPTGQFDHTGSSKPGVFTNPVNYSQEGKPVSGINELATPRVFSDDAFGLLWSTLAVDGFGYFPQYFVDTGSSRVPVAEHEVPAALANATFTPASTGPAYSAPLTGAWATPGPTRGPYRALLRDGSVVTYHWYRFIDQPVFQQYAWTAQQKDALQALVEAIHANWTPQKTYMLGPAEGAEVALDAALLVTPPPGLETGYVPIVVRQEAFAPDPGRPYAIEVKASGRRWCVDDGVGGNGLVATCTKADEFVFDTPEQDGHVRITSVRSGRHLHLDGSADKLLSTRYQPDDAFTRFRLEIRDDGHHRLTVKATGAHLHADESSDRLLSTRYQPDDDYTRFKLIPLGIAFADGFEARSDGGGIAF